VAVEFRIAMGADVPVGRRVDASTSRARRESRTSVRVEPDADSLSAWRPESADFSLAVRLMVGPVGADGEESFDLTVCTGGWLAAKATTVGVLDARHHLVVDRFHWPTIRQYLDGRIRSCSGKTWDEVTEQIGRFAYWEFEDYETATGRDS
jgi:hypothetical protein